jgi:hypothetical protein
VTLEEISRLPVGALLRADDVFYLIYERVHSASLGSVPLVMIVDWEATLGGDHSHPSLSQHLAMDVINPDFAEARRVA